MPYKLNNDFHGAVVIEARDGLSAHSNSDYISLEQKTANISFETTLRAEAIHDKATVVEVVGIDFYQALAHAYEPFTQGRAARVIGVF